MAVLGISADIGANVADCEHPEAFPFIFSFKRLIILFPRTKETVPLSPAILVKYKKPDVFQIIAEDFVIA
jgi:hypothetical protein